MLAKVVDKVMANTTALEMGKAGESFINPKREKKVAGLIDSYVQRRKQEKDKDKKGAQEEKDAKPQAAPADGKGK